MAKDLFYETLHQLTGHFPKFGRTDASFKLPRRIKRVINLVDSTTIQLFANCMDWAKHRRRKAAAKCHLMLHPWTQKLTFHPHVHGIIPAGVLSKDGDAWGMPSRGNSCCRGTW